MPTSSETNYRYLRAIKDTNSELEAYVKARKDSNGIEEIAYPSGERARGYAAAILWNSDLAPVCSFTEVSVEDTPFEGDVDV